jgi:hypothetical protein
MARNWYNRKKSGATSAAGARPESTLERHSRERDETQQRQARARDELNQQQEAETAALALRHTYEATGQGPAPKDGPSNEPSGEEFAALQRRRAEEASAAQDAEEQQRRFAPAATPS